MVKTDTELFWKRGQKSQLAKKSGVSKQYLSDIINCRRRAPCDLAIRLEAASLAMGIHIDKTYFLFPHDAPSFIFNTSEVKAQKKKLRQESLRTPLFDLECDELIKILNGGQGRLPAKKIPSKRTLRMLDAIAKRVVAFEEARIVSATKMWVDEFLLEKQQAEKAAKTAKDAKAAAHL